ncbi:MAG: hypothetical protein ACYCUF_00415 [Acidimicrobiales bacterium]
MVRTEATPSRLFSGSVLTAMKAGPGVVLARPVELPVTGLRETGLRETGCMAA